jgi:phosphatidylglycerophosphate synthase
MKALILNPSEVCVGGVSLRERLERMLKQLSISEIEYIPAGARLQMSEPVLLLRGDTLFDPRIVQALLSSPSNFVAVDSRQPEAWVGAARLEPDFFQKTELSVRSLDSIAEQARCDSALLDISQIDSYTPKLRRDVPIYWLQIKSPDDVRRAEQILMDSAEKDPSDLMAKFVHRPIESWMVTRLARTPITPNQVTLFVNLLAYLATALFATGHLLAAALMTLLVGVTDGFDGKLARLKGMVTKVGSLEHAFDLLFEFSWILALGYYLAQTEGTLPLLLAAAILTLVAFYRSIYERYGQVTGKSLDVAGKFENTFRRIAGRRNLFSVEILLCVLWQRPLWALYLIFFHAALTALVYAWRAWSHLHNLDRQ